uniref:RING-type domain-containing protein n=1 Tax=Salix viminalis TaxID=40686 RepID=A0A6N2K3T3_SALVM
MSRSFDSHSLFFSFPLMGGKSSREANWSSNPSSWDAYQQPSYSQEIHDPPPPPTPPPQQSYTSQQSYGSHQHYTSSQDHGGAIDRRRLDRRYSRIADDYKSLQQVTEALARAGLESSNLIVGIDFTKSNEWTGAKSFNRRSLHHIGDGFNPYEQAISIIGKTLAAFDEDNLIPCFGFGDASTHDQDVFSFYPDERFCNGFEEVLSQYREIVPNLRLAELDFFSLCISFCCRTYIFAPVIEMAMTIVEKSGGQYHVLLIIADGQVTRSVDTEHGQLSPQEQKTVEAIVRARWAWDMMREFDDNIPDRDFDNFQFVNFTEIMSKNAATSRKETEFALSALMEIPSHQSIVSERVPLPPPMYSAASFSSSKPSRPASFEPSVPSYQRDSQPFSSAPPATCSTYDNQVCPICLCNPKDMAFGCGHQTCCDCGETLQLCPICRSSIETRIRLY